MLNILNNNQINTLKTLNDVKIEVVGFWVWISGDTYKYKDILKEIGFLYSKNKKCWFFNGSNKKIKYFSKYKNLNEIKNKYVSYELLKEND